MINGRSTVPMSKHQLGQQGMHHGNLSPGTGEIHSAPCVIVEVYDQERLEAGDVPDEVLQKISRFPNVVYARIRLGDGRMLNRPFKDTASQLYSTHGNSLVLEGASARIEFYNARVRTGKIVLSDDVTSQPVNMQSAADVYDIGLLV